MHIPDGFLSVTPAVAAAVLAAGGLGVSLRAVRREGDARRIPLIALAAAFVFAAQMLNFPVAGGTSGHLIGATLCAVLLGPAGAVVAMSAVLILQCLLFSDGGLTALGANLLNMAVIAPWVGFAVCAAIVWVDDSLRGRLMGAFAGAWCSTLAAASACALELVASGAGSGQLVFPAMAGIHMLIGIGEAFITAFVLAGIAKVRPDLFGAPARAGRMRGRSLACAVLLPVAIVVLLAPFASSWPDGLEAVAVRLGFESLAVKPAFDGLMPDYRLAGVTSPAAATIMAGLIGTVLVFVLAWIVARGLTVRGRHEGTEGDHGGCTPSASA